MSENQIIIMVKKPIAGQVKTRLMPTLTAEAAVSLSEKMFLLILEVVSQLDADCHVFCYPDCDHPVFRECAKHYSITLHQQKGHDLGSRLAGAFKKCLRISPHCLAIGADCPAMESSYLNQGLTHLSASADVVLGPAEDGGYVLIGMNKFFPALFEGIPWGTDNVLNITRKRLIESQLTHAELSTLWDVDNADDLSRLKSLNF